MFIHSFTHSFMDTCWLTTYFLGICNHRAARTGCCCYGLNGNNNYSLSSSSSSSSLDRFFVRKTSCWFIWLFVCIVAWWTGHPPTHHCNTWYVWMKHSRYITDCSLHSSLRSYASMDYRLRSLWLSSSSSSLLSSLIIWLSDWFHDFMIWWQFFCLALIGAWRLESSLLANVTIIIHQSWSCCYTTLTDLVISLCLLSSCYSHQQSSFSSSLGCSTVLHIFVAIHTYLSFTACLAY